MTTEATIPDSEKVRIVSDFLQHAPPGFNAVRMLLNNDQLLKEGCAQAITKYNESQFVPVKLEGVEKQTLVTPFNDIGGGRYVDDASKKTFKYDHLRKEASDIQPHAAESGAIESWRAALQKELDAYIDDHYTKNGVGCVFVRQGGITLCIESHQFQPKNFCNGRWRSEWKVPVGDGKTGSQELVGKIKVQVHYYEDGNVQLFSEKDCNVKVQVTSDLEKTAKEIVSLIRDEEGKYQVRVFDYFSSTTFLIYLSGPFFTV
ncbi:f-actin capping protein alpha subunit [Oesophagostomum dentatum]|uniref:F-actin-capping protein subunit alpha n=1 Tax=Oesophagostomum dentatum TaxID=61180 RepID=A0A0B1SKU4_OESDE|nr:f-actin capping protein alpha subunit [Oesophagostomum dentatum]